MKSRFMKFCSWAQANWLALVIFLTVVWMLFLCIVAFSWLYGFWANGLYGTHFDLGSCWQGIGAIMLGFGSILGLAKAAWTKYQADSEHNTLPGHAPDEQTKDSRQSEG